MGAALLCWYNTPEKVEYLFGLGQVSLLAWPLDDKYEEADGLYTKPIGRPHYWTDSEQKIFGKSHLLTMCIFMILTRDGIMYTQEFTTLRFLWKLYGNILRALVSI